MRSILLLPLLFLPLAAAPLRAQGCDDPRATAEMARIRQEIGAPDVMCVEFARGDVDGDGRDDAVLDIGYEVMGMENGSRSRLYVLFGDPAAPLAAEPDEPRGAVQAVRIDGPVIRVETLASRPDDPPCCPSLIGTMVLRVEGRALLRALDL
ncbi:hypothetical protein [Longimicrobium sp.]|uniref:hypothetical protein n=1 Tax=Longimicrobium sp. TaxID=2029185 RepID=UPI002E345877|nr:hypothetical protein [Longimicrobium sp.]HEX6042449.1 hypothetical protein [Longimicrobium sp.]